MTPLTRNASALAILLTTFVARWPFRSVPLIRDEGELAHLAQGLRTGVVPYLEIYNQKPPVSFSLIALLQTVGGESIEALRLGVTLWFFVGAVALFALGRRWLSDGAALLALAAYCLLGFGQAGFFHQASTEVMALPFVAIGLGAWLRARADEGAGAVRGRRVIAALGAGAAAALAYQTKQTGIALAAAIALDTLATGSPRRQRATWLSACWAAAGFIAVTASIAAALAASGALGAYLDATWIHNWAYVGSRQGQSPAGFPVAITDLPLWLAGAGGLLIATLQRRHEPLRTVGLLGVASLAAALFAGHDYAHYYLPLIVPLALGVGALADELSRRISPTIALVVIAAVAASPLLGALQLVRTADSAIASVLARAPTVAQARSVADYLSERTAPGEAVTVLGSEPQVYFLAGRPAHTRMAIAYPMSGGYPHSEALRRELIDALTAGGSRYVVLPEDWRSFAEARGHAQELQHHISEALEGRYALDREFEGSYRVLKRSEVQPIRLLLLVTADTLRADHIGAYGNGAVRTPALDALARDSVRFTASYAPAPYTLPSIAALHTGRYPEELGILANHALFRGTDATIAEQLRLHGWRAGAVVSNYVLRRGTGIEAGFELYDDTLPSSETNRDQPERTAAGTTDAALAALDQLLEQPGNGVFLWVHFQDPHGPYLPPGDRRERYLASARSAPDGAVELPVRGINPIGAIPNYQAISDRRDVGFYRAGYAGEIDFLDGEIGRLLAGVEARVARAATTVVFTADHGESLGENDYWFAHGAFLSDALVRVPLLVRAAGLEPGVRQDIVSLIDLAPTLLGAVGVVAPDGLRGRDLLAPGAAASSGTAYLANLMGGKTKRWGWVEGGHVLVSEESEDGSQRDTLRPLDGATVPEPGTGAAMRTTLDQFRAGLRVQPEVQQHLSPRDREMLRLLGYAE